MKKVTVPVERRDGHIKIQVTPDLVLLVIELAGGINNVVHLTPESAKSMATGLQSAAEFVMKHRSS